MSRMVAGYRPQQHPQWQPLSILIFQHSGNLKGGKPKDIKTNSSEPTEEVRTWCASGQACCHETTDKARPVRAQLLVAQEDMSSCGPSRHTGHLGSQEKLSCDTGRHAFLCPETMCLHVTKETCLRVAQEDMSSCNTI